MANNINTRRQSSTLLKNKLAQLTIKVKDLHQNQLGQTKEDLIRELNNAMSTFFHKLNKPLFNPITIIPDQLPDRDQYNLDFEDIDSDLIVLFTEFENVESVILDNFNFIVSDTNRLFARLKSTFSKLGDYILFVQNPNRDTLYLTDSFNNLSRIDISSKLLSAEQADIDQTQGIATLPINWDAQVPIKITKEPIINKNSNGITGNNHEAGRGINNDISVLLDDNPDTWFEYEIVTDTQRSEAEPLILDLLITLDKAQPVNFLRINPNNFGTKVPVFIDTVETSLDGNSYISIKDDIPLNGFLTEDEENTFLLAPSSSKFAGQGVFTFTARQLKYVHLILKQSTPYAIIDKDTSASRLRYAIGIRDIEIASLPFKETGELISTELEIDEPISKVVLVTHQNPIGESELAAIKHSVSPDNGATWYTINPIDFTGNIDTSDIINFNTLDSNSITTQSPVTSLRYRAELSRNSAAFSGPTSKLHKALQSKTELLSIPTESPFELELSDIPLPESIRVLQPMLGSRGIDNKRYIVAMGTNSSLEVELPFNNIKLDFDKISGRVVEVGPEEIRVGGELWTKGVLSAADEEDKVYEIDYVKGIIRMGNNTNGKAPPGDVPVDIKLQSERLYLTDDISQTAPLDYPTVDDKSACEILLYKEIASAMDVLKLNSKVNKLSFTDLVTSPVFSNTTIFADEKDFVDGSSELEAAGDYSVDTDNGMVYSFTATSSEDVITAYYTYQPIHTLTEDEWEFVNGTVHIKDEAFLTIEIEEEDISASTRYICLDNFSIIRGSIVFAGSGAGTIFHKEVDFINGSVELTNTIKTTETIPVFTATAGANSYDLRLKITSATEYKPAFSDTSFFGTEVGSLGAVTSAGKYYIDRSANTIYFWVTTAGETTVGDMTYHYVLTSKSTAGLYSVNYKTGEIFTASSTTSDLTIAYSYTNYQANYHIGRLISSNDFTFDVETNTLTLTEKEILDKLNLEGPVESNYYHVTFDHVIENRENISSIEPFFTPVLKDYALKLIPESSLKY